MKYISKFLLVFSAFILLISSCVSCVNRVTVPENLPSRSFLENSLSLTNAIESTVALVRPSFVGGNVRTYCTAFYIRSNIIATAAHCVGRESTTPLMDSDPPQIGDQILFFNHQQFVDVEQNRDSNPNTATVIAFNTTTDVALLRTAVLSRHFLNIRNSEPIYGERIYTVSMPAGLPWILSEGLISQTIHDTTQGGLTTIFASSGIFFGSSGCALLDRNGNVIGIASALVMRQGNLASYAPIRRLRTLISETRL